MGAMPHIVVRSARGPLAQPLVAAAASRQAAVVPRIAICGSGVAGPSLAGILSKQLGKAVKIDIFERTPAGSDQGYGLDLDEHGQEALARAGVYHRFWEMARPYSDSVLICGPRGENPVRFCRPRFLQAWLPQYFAARPECNRAALREILLGAAVERGVAHIHFDTRVVDIRKARDCTITGEGGGRRIPAVELLGIGGRILGEYDVVVDAMGWNSTLRQHRIEPRAQVAAAGSDGSSALDRGRTVALIHGSVNNPEETWSQGLLDWMGQAGTFAIRGQRTMILQRYGAGPADNRTAFFYFVDRDDPDSLFREMGIVKPTSRASGIWTGDSLAKVKQFLHKDLGDAVDSRLHEAIDSLDRITVRANYSNDLEVQFKQTDLPLICIGDSLRHSGFGGGGILAMRDTLELAAALTRADAFDQFGGCNLVPIRQIESRMLQRKDKDKKKNRRAFATLDLSNSWSHNVDHALLPLPADASAGERLRIYSKRAAMKLAGNTLIGIFSRLHAREARRYPGRVGSDAESPIYPSVGKALEEDKAKEKRAERAEGQPLMSPVVLALPP